MSATNSKPIAKKYRIIVGNLNQTFDEAHSADSFDTMDEALCYWWAMRRTLYPQRVWLHCGLDGWVSNDQTIGKELPPRLASRIQEIIAEDDEITKDTGSECDYVGMGWIGANGRP